MNTFRVPPGPHRDIETVMKDLGKRLGLDAGPTPPGSAALTLNGQPLLELDEHIRKANNFKAVAPDYHLRSHRRLLRYVVDPVKKFLLWGIRPHLNLLIERQERFNEASMQVFWAAFRALAEQQEAMKATHKKLAEKAASLEALREGVAALGDDHMKQQVEFNAHFEKSRAELFAGLDELRDAHRRIHIESVLEACRRGDDHIKKQVEINAYFEQTRTDFTGRIAELYEADRRIRLENVERAEADRKFAEDQREINARLLGRHDLQDFYDAIKPEVRDRLIDKHRGSFGHLRGLHHVYLDFFRNRPGHIVDVGCGRGEFLSMMRGEGVPAWGCDIDATMVEACRANEVHAIQADALGVFDEVEPGTLGGVFASQVIEHLFPGELLRFISQSFAKLAPGGAVALETVNPQSLGVLAKSYYKDLDHKQAIDPDYLGSLLELAGFVNVEVHKVRPFDAPDKIPDLPSAAELGLGAKAHETLAGIVSRLNERIWGPQDYYVRGEKPGK